MVIRKMGCGMGRGRRGGRSGTNVRGFRESAELTIQLVMGLTVIRLSGSGSSI